MNFLSAISILTILISTSTTPINITEFWKSQTQAEDVHFQSFAGYQEIDWYRNRGESGMYYQLFGAMGADLEEDKSKIPLIIWLQGGPGSSSLYGAYTQVGPVRIVQQKPVLKLRSWNIQSHLLFVDQPLNVGFSYDNNRGSKSQVSSVAQASQHLLNFLYNFYKSWPYLKNCPLYILGESDGARFAIGLAKLLISNSSMNILPKGVLINSGWIDPPNQVNYYDSLLYSSGIVSNRFRDILSSLQTKAAVNIYKTLYANASEDINLIARSKNLSNQYWGGMSLNNLKSYEEEDNSMEKYLQKFKGQLGVSSNIDFIPQNQDVLGSFTADLMKTYTKDLLSVLANPNLNVIIFNGQNDYVVNSAGVQNYINALSWPRINTWKNTKKQIWLVDEKVKGWAKIYLNLWLVVVNGAGHQVAKDQPESCFNLLGRFLNNDRNWNK